MILMSTHNIGVYEEMAKRNGEKLSFNYPCISHSNDKNNNFTKNAKIDH